MEKKERLVAGYLRVRTNRQSEEDNSLDEQEKQIRRYCEFKEWKNLTFYREDVEPAKDTDRIRFRQLLQDIEAGKINTVIINKISQLSRSISNCIELFKFFDQHDIDLISLQENLDTSSPIGKALTRIILEIAQLEREETEKI